MALIRCRHARRRTAKSSSKVASMLVMPLAAVAEPGFRPRFLRPGHILPISVPPNHDGDCSSRLPTKQPCEPRIRHERNDLEVDQTDRTSTRLNSSHLVI